jgi:hypothetical protein
MTNVLQERKTIETDCIASKPWYYTVQDGELLYGRTVMELLPYVKEKTVDYKAITDLLKYEYVLYDRTLIREIRSVPPSSSLSFGDAGVGIGKISGGPKGYFSNISEGAFIGTVFREFQKAVKNALDRCDGKRIGVLLSGGLDSRLLASVVASYRKDVITISYDGNPFGSLNLRIAAKVAKKLHVKNIQVPFDRAIFTPENIEKAVMLADGMRSWIHGAFPVVTLGDMLNENMDVLITAHGQGEFFGEFDLGNSWMFNNFIPNYHHKGVITDRLIDTVDVFACNPALLQLLIFMPRSLRWGEYKPIAPLKLALLRGLNNGVARIPCERTGVPPCNPMWWHYFWKYPHYLLRKKRNLQFAELIAENNDYFDALIDSFLSREGIGPILPKKDTDNLYEIFTATASTIEIFLQNAGV